MPAKKRTYSRKTPAYVPTKKEADAATKRAQADMKKHGFKTVEELEAYYDSKRGY